jgi:C4-dicarboxylate transporter
LVIVANLGWGISAEIGFSRVMADLEEEEAAVAALSSPISPIVCSEIFYLTRKLVEQLAVSEVGWT